MAHHPNDGSNDNPDEFSELRDNHKTDGQLKAENHQEGAKRANDTTAGQPAGDNAVPQTSGTPNYGDFGHAPSTTTGTTATVSSDNTTGVAAPRTAAPEQRGSAPQNLDPAAVRATQDASEAERREAYKQDDPRYGGGTRNWESAEPANRTTQSTEDPNDNTLS